MTQNKIRFKSYDGFELEGTFLKAKAEKAALLFVHGITSSRDELGFHSEYAEFLALNGISSLRFDYRFHGGKDDGNPMLKELSLCGIVNDIDAAFEALIKNVDSKINAFFIIGTSFGGGLSAFWVDYNKKEQIKKVILNAPVINYEDDVLTRNNLLQNELLANNAVNALNKKGFITSSEIAFGRGLINELRYINGIKAIQNLGDLVVIFHGDEDEDVPLASSQKYMSATTSIEIIKGVGHGFGVHGDEDLDFPETKKIHNTIYAKAVQIIENSL